MSSTALKKRLEAMQEPTEGNEYYALTLTATEDGKLAWSTHSEFVGLTQTKPPRELRAACRVDGDKMLALWRDLGTPGLVMDSREDLSLFVLLGGNAIIEASLATEHFLEMLEPRQFVPTGLVTMRLLDETDSYALQRAPTPRLRMQVLKRDGYRCRVCGRRAEDHVDIELHIHHFRPWAKGGLTEPANLMTLCHTCHKGLNPHFDMDLVNIFPEAHEEFENLLGKLGKYRSEYVAGIRRYREIMWRRHADRAGSE